MLISQIKWGDDSAEKDPNLLNYFITTETMERISSFQKDFIIGRKGAGKSAIRKKLSSIFRQYADQTLVEVIPTYGNMRSILNNKDICDNYNDPLFYQYFWLSLLYQEALFALDVKQLLPANSNIKSLVDEFNRTRKTIPQIIADFVNRLKIKAGKLGEFGANIDLSLRTESSVEKLENAILEIVNRGYKITWVVDDLDTCWDNSSSANNMIFGLMLTLNYLKSVSQSFHLFICLREDIYQIILKNHQHSDKFRSVERLKWSHENLIRMLTERIEYNLNNNNEPIENSFHKIFPETVGASNTTNWIIERTLSRPRELLQLVRIYSESNPSETPNSELLKEAEISYSNWKLDDLCSEFSNEYPGLDRVFTVWKTKYYRIKYHLTKNELENICIEILASANINQQWFEDLYAHTDVNGLRNILFKIGFIGDFILGGEGGSKVIYSFNEAHDPLFNEVQVHHCFRKAVGTVDRIR